MSPKAMDCSETTGHLSVRNLRTVFPIDGRDVPVIEGINFDLNRGEVLGIVGESGSGKSVTALSVLQLISAPGRVSDGEILFEGRDLRAMSARELNELRGSEIAIIFQEPMTALNPVFTIGAQIIEMLRLHRPLSAREARDRAIELLEHVEISEPRRRIDEYPHQLSGGMRQRAMIAMALACSPKILIADEPTTALDVTVQAQILDLLKNLQAEMDMSVILITHDLGVVAQVAHRVIVMYGGRIVEQATVSDLFKNPKHPYTEALIASVPRLDRNTGAFISIDGSVPAIDDMPEGCRFAERCPRAFGRCTEAEPALQNVGPGHIAACWLHDEAAGT